MVFNHTEACLLFDWCISALSKVRTRWKHTLEKEIRYKISNSTNISSISLKFLLSHNDAKQDLNVYLAKKSKFWFEAPNKQYIVTYRISESNVEGFHDI